MPLKQIEILFRPPQNMENSQIRKFGAILTALSFVVVLSVFVLSFGIFITLSPSVQQIIPFTLLIGGFFLIIGVHRLIWGNISNDPIYISWGKGILSTISGIAIIMISSIVTAFITGIVAGYLKQIN